MLDPSHLTGKPLPANEEAEAALIARLLVDPEQVAAVSLDPADLYVGVWRQAFVAMQRLASEHKRIDILTLQDALGDRSGELGQRVAEVSSYRAPIEEYVGIIRRDAFRRRVIAGLGRVVSSAYITEDRDAILAEIHDAIVQISAGVEDEMLITAGQAVDGFLRVLEERRHGRKTGLRYGFPSIDALINPALAGEMIVFAARPSVGKTAIAEMIADNWAEQSEYPILFCSLEMSLAKLLTRTVSRYADLPAQSLVRGKLTDKDYILAVQATEDRRSVGIWYLDDGRATTSSVRAAAAKVRILANGIGGIVIDYLQLLKDAGDQEVQRVTRISRNVKALAREFEVPVLVLSQLNRSLESRDDKHPKLYDLRESGAIEQDADVVVGLYRELGTSMTDLDVLKQRDGGVGRLHLSFDMEHVRFGELPIKPLGYMGIATPQEIPW